MSRNFMRFRNDALITIMIQKKIHVIVSHSSSMIPVPTKYYKTPRMRCSVDTAFVVLTVLITSTQAAAVDNPPTNAPQAAGKHGLEFNCKVTKNVFQSLTYLLICCQGRKSTGINDDRGLGPKKKPENGSTNTGPVKPVYPWNANSAKGHVDLTYTKSMISFQHEDEEPFKDNFYDDYDFEFPKGMQHNGNFEGKVKRFQENATRQMQQASNNDKIVRDATAQPAKKQNCTKQPTKKPT